MRTGCQVRCYNIISFLKYLEGKNFIKYVFNLIIFIYLLFLIIFNLSNFRQASKIFINSYAFGHSVIESSIFFYEYGPTGVCISVGNRKNRNKYLKLLFKPHTLLHFWLPSLHNINIYQALRLRAHNTIEHFFKKSKIIKVIIGKSLCVVDREFLCNRVAVRNLQQDYRLSEERAAFLLNKFTNAYKVEGHAPLASLHYLAQQKTPIDYSLSGKLIKFNNRFLNKARSINKNYSSNELKICTLVLRRSWKPWSGQGIDSFYQSIEYLASKNYLINIIGDLEDIDKLKSFNNIYWHKHFNMNSQIFQILSIINSSFCIGDQSGVQTLIHFLNKKNLIINSLPFGQLQYNSVVLPRLWTNKNQVKATSEEHFDRLLYRFHSTKSDKGEMLYPQYYSPKTVLDAVRSFVEKIETHNQVEGLYPQQFFKSDPDSMLIFSKNASFSPILLKELKI